MKKLITVFCLFVLIGISYSQQASDYFPEQTGFVWNYRSTPLDSLNNKIDSLAYARRDTFAVVSMHQGKNANIVPTKSGPFETINLQNYDDTLFYHFDGTDGYDFFDLGPLEIIIAQLDSLGIDSTFNFVHFFKSLEDWYPTYNFAATIGIEDKLLSIDTVINTPYGEYTFRFEYLSKRLEDETLQITIGDLDCKKFFLKWKVSVLLFPPPLPPTEVLSTENTIWIAIDYWIVQDFIPTNYIDLSFFLVDPFSIPGVMTEIESITNIAEEFNSPETFYLSQNYPNPFNPDTKIRFSIPQGMKRERGDVTLKVYDVLGNEVATLVNEYKPSGIYEVEFSAKDGSASGGDAYNLPSGIYFYKLRAGDFVETKKMLLLK